MAPNTPVDWALVVEHSALVKNVAGNLLRTLPANSGVSHADLMDAGMLGLIAASRRFDPARGFKFATFAKHRVHGAMFDWLQRSQRDRAALSIDELHPNTLRAPEPDDAQEQANHVGLWRLVKRLPERTQQIFDLYYGQGMSDYQIAPTLGVTAPRVCRIRQEGLKRLRRLARQPEQTA